MWPFERNTEMEHACPPFRVVRKVFVGLRTVLTCIFLAVVGLADQYELVDVLNTVRSLLGESARLGAILVGIAVVFFVLRMFTRGPLAAGVRNKNEDDGE